MRLLVIDDDTFFRKFSSTQLAEKGYDVDTAMNGEEGLQKAQTFHPEMILLDIIMPKMDGFDTLALLKSNEVTKNIPIIVFSTLGQEKDIEKAKSLGAIDHINKNFFDIDTIVAKINTIKNPRV